MSSYLPSNEYSGTVANIAITYRSQIVQLLQNSQNVGLKRKLEETAVQAAQERGFSNVMILSIFHSTTRDSRGDRVIAPLHCTIRAGTGRGVTAHVEIGGLQPLQPPENWYDSVYVTAIKWDDRATSSNASTPPAPSPPQAQGYNQLQPQAQGYNHQPQAGYNQFQPQAQGYNQLQPQAQGYNQFQPGWVPTGQDTPGYQWAYYDGTKYTGVYR